MKPQTERALGQYLGVRERSREEIARYLKKRKVEAEEIEQVLGRWQELGIVNDASFISSVIRSYLKKGKGPLFIRQKLSQSGIAREAINEAILGISQNDIRESMEKRLTKMGRKLAGLSPKDRRQKALAILSASGFLSDLSMRFIDDWVIKE